MPIAPIVVNIAVITRSLNRLASRWPNVGYKLTSMALTVEHRPPERGGLSVLPPAQPSSPACQKQGGGREKIGPLDGASCCLKPRRASMDTDRAAAPSPLRPHARCRMHPARCYLPFCSFVTV